MSKDALEVISADQAQRIDRIKEYHRQSSQSATDQRDASILCAFELTVLKEITPHKQFLPLVERCFPDLGIRMCQYYMNGLRRLASKCETVSLLREKAVNAPLSDLAETDKGKLLTEVIKATDAVSATDWLRAAGALREKERPKHTPVNLTPEEKLQADLSAAEAALHDICTGIVNLRENETAGSALIAKCKPDTRRQLLTEALWLTKTLRKFNKGRKPRK